MKISKPQINQEDMMKLLDTLYDKSIQGVEKVSVPVNVMADDYLQKHADGHLQQNHLLIIRLQNAQLQVL